MSKKASVDFMAGFRSLEQRDGVHRHKPAEITPVAPASTSAGKVNHVQQGSRRGKVAVTQWVDPAVRKQLAQLALDHDRSQSDFVVEGLNLLFEKYGKSPIASS